MDGEGVVDGDAFETPFLVVADQVAIVALHLELCVRRGEPIFYLVSRAKASIRAGSLAAVGTVGSK